MIKKCLNILVLTFCINFLFAQTKNEGISKDYDVVICGATPAGIAAAINAAEENMKVALIEDHARIGGMLASGMGNLDVWSKESLGGTFMEFLTEVGKQYGVDTAVYTFGSEVALKAFERMLRSHSIDIFTEFRLQSSAVEKVNDELSRIKSVEVLDLNNGHQYIFQGKVFIDATYEGDLFAMAGADYRIGSEGKKKFNEPSAPEESNGHVMGYNFRVIVTRDPENKIPFDKPLYYNPDESFPKLIEAAKKNEITKLQNQLIQILPAGPEKFNLNDYKSSKYEGFNVYNESDDWPEATSEKRQEIYDLAKFKAKSFFYFLANDSRLPQHVRDEMAEYGYPKDEFIENDHFPPWLYVREGRRLKGVMTVTEFDFLEQEGSARSKSFKDAVATGHFPMNSHGTYIDKNGNELGNFLVRIPPFEVPYGVMIPERINGLLVPVAISSSQLAFGAIRMEPTWTALGQAAGLAAVQAIKNGQYLRNLNIEQLQKRLHDKNALTFYTKDIPPSSPYFLAVQYFGNRGLFHNLKNNRPELSRERLPHHFILPEEPLKDSLKNEWIDYLKNNLKVKLSKKSIKILMKANTRGEFILRAYEIVSNQ